LVSITDVSIDGRIEALKQHAGGNKHAVGENIIPRDEQMVWTSEY
jgi:hypothetical protein